MRFGESPIESVELKHVINMGIQNRSVIDLCVILIIFSLKREEGKRAKGLTVNARSPGGLRKALRNRFKAVAAQSSYLKINKSS